MKDAIGYLRVSTREQGRSGLSFAAQRFDIEHFGKREGFSIASWYQDIQTGAGSDPLSLRLGLASALKDARSARCPLIVSRLDRLSRNVHFIAGQMEHKVHFMVAAFGRDVDAFTLHIYASIAQQERKMIGERVRAAAQIAKRRGRKFGLQLRSKSWQRRVSALGRAALRREALVRAQAYRVYVEWALGQLGPNSRPISFRAAAIKLNERHIDTPLGGRWRGHQVQRMARRLGLDHPVAYLAYREDSCEMVPHRWITHSFRLNFSPKKAQFCGPKFRRTQAQLPRCNFKLKRPSHPTTVAETAIRPS